MVPSSIDPFPPGAAVIAIEDGAVIVLALRHSHGARLAHPHAVAVPAAVELQRGDEAGLVALRREHEERALQSAEHAPHLQLAADLLLAVIAAQAQEDHAARGPALHHVEVP